MSVGTIALTAMLMWYFNSIDHETTLWGTPVAVERISDRASRFEYETGPEKLVVNRITMIERVAAEQLIEEKIFQFGSLFEKQRVGYKGQHTEFVECSERFRPVLESKELNEGTLRYFRGYANDRFVPGACDEDSVSFHFVGALLYCHSSKTFYDVEYFTAVDESTTSDVFIDRVSCQQ